MVAALVALLAVASGGRIAYTARYYYPPGDGRISHYQVYVCDLDGENKRQITTGTFDCHTVRWTGPDSLAWVVHGRKESELWSTTTPGAKKPTLLKTAGSIYGIEAVLSDAASGAEFAIDERRYSLHKGKLRAIGATPTPKPGVFALEGPKPPAKARVEVVNDLGDFKLLVTTLAGKPSAKDHLGDNCTFVRTFSKRAGGEFLIATYYGNSTLRGTTMVERINWQTGELEGVAFGSDLDFRPDRALWAGVTTRDLVDYENVTIWTSDATVGNWKTGERASLAKGLVDFTSISIWPG
jgi:hypothetical protein